MTKLPVRDVMAVWAATTTGDATAREAAAAMRAANTGSLVVTDDERPVGIVTERDIVHKVVAPGENLNSPVRAIMSEPLITAAPDTEVADAARLMARHRVRRLPVMDAGGLVGMLTDRDILAISPALMELWTDNGSQPVAGEPEPGVCEGCESLVEGLRLQNGTLLCEDCAEEAQ